MPKAFDPYHQWLGIGPEDQPPNHYRLLGIPLFEADRDVIANAATRQMAHLRTFALGRHSDLSQTLLNEVAAAKLRLLVLAQPQPPNLIQATHKPPPEARVNASPFIRLIDVKPQSWATGWGPLGVNSMDYFPLLKEDSNVCEEFLYAHAPSRVTYALPPDAKSFSAIGYCLSGRDVRFRVLGDGEPLVEGRQGSIVPIKCDLPEGCKTIELIVDALNQRNSGCSYWLLPRFWPIPQERTVLDGEGTHTKVTQLKPTSTQVGSNVFLVNRCYGRTPPPVQVFDEAPCDEFLFAHAFSYLTYPIPRGASEFSAIGYCTASATVRFRVFADGRQLLTSRQAGIVPIRVHLPEGAKRLDLVVDPMDSGIADHSYWCYPRFYGDRVEQPTPWRIPGRPAPAPETADYK
jgi:hypothetical protein